MRNAQSDIGMRRRVGTIFPHLRAGVVLNQPGPCRLGVDHSLPRVSYSEEERSRPNKSEGCGVLLLRRNTAPAAMIQLDSLIPGPHSTGEESRDHCLAMINWSRRGEIRELRSATQKAATTPVKTSMV